MMTLQDIGFTLGRGGSLYGTADPGLRLPDLSFRCWSAAAPPCWNRSTLEEKQLARLDYLRHKLQCQLAQDHPRR